MLTTNNITYKIEGKTLLDNISVVFEAGKLNMIIGPNGAGKSTLIKILCNQVQPATGGTVSFGSRNLNDYSNIELARIRSVLSQNVELAFPLTVNEVVMMGRYPHFTGKPTQKDIDACEGAMKFFDVNDLADRNYLTLSGGEKQRVNFARVISQIWYPVENNCRYLILDEPLTFLDVHYQFDFIRKITELLKSMELVAIAVVHDLNLAARFADKILLLNQGKILADGDRHEVLTKENIMEAYKLEPHIRFEKDEMYLLF